MTTVFNKIHRLKQQPGWTWDLILSEVDKISAAGLDEKTIYSHYRQPHKKPNNHVTKIINQLHDSYFPNPFPEDLNRIMRIYNNLLNCKAHSTVDKDIQDFEYFVKEQVSREGKNNALRYARLNWLLGNIQFDRLGIYRDNGQRQQLNSCKQQAIVYYQQSVDHIELHNQENAQHEVGASHLYKARHNILACYLNSVPQQQRKSDEALLQYLTESNFISNSKQTLVAEPFQWNIARNGLRFSSLIKNKPDVEYFFKALVKVSRRFLDLKYKPLNCGPISSGSDFQWAIQTVITDDYLQQSKQ